MSSRLLTAAVAALTLGVAMAPALDAYAQDYHNRGGDQRGDYRGRDSRDHRGDRGRGRDATGALITGMALGAALGSYSGRPYYCRNHHHWRWSHRLGRYVYDYNNRC